MTTRTIPASEFAVASSLMAWLRSQKPATLVTGFTEVRIHEVELGQPDGPDIIEFVTVKPKPKAKPKWVSPSAKKKAKK